jgi:hypothetical protein
MLLEYLSLCNLIESKSSAIGEISQGRGNQKLIFVFRYFLLGRWEVTEEDSIAEVDDTRNGCINL